jgi:hypothetical protein
MVFSVTESRHVRIHLHKLTHHLFPPPNKPNRKWPLHSHNIQHKLFNPKYLLIQFLLTIHSCPSFTLPIKDKVHPRTGREGPEGEQRYRSTLSFTSALDGGGWSTPRSGRFTPGKETRCPLYRRLGGPQGRSGRRGKSRPPLGFDSPTVQPLASAIPTEIFRPTRVKNYIR